MRVLFFILVIFISSVSAQTNFEKATQLANSRSYEQALKLYEQILFEAESNKADDNYLARIHFNIGICRYHLKQPSQAVAELTKAIETSKGGYQKAFYALGMAQVELKNRRAAENAFLDSLKLKKDDGEAWFDLALVYLEEKDYERAEKAVRNSIKYKSVASADAHNNLGVIYVLNGNYTLAESEFKTALAESNNRSIEAVANLRYCLYYKDTDAKDLIAKLEFSTRNNKSGV